MSPLSPHALNAYVHGDIGLSCFANIKALVCCPKSESDVAPHLSRVEGRKLHPVIYLNCHLVARPLAQRIEHGRNRPFPDFFHEDKVRRGPVMRVEGVGFFRRVGCSGRKEVSKSKLIMMLPPRASLPHR